MISIGAAGTAGRQGRYMNAWFIFLKIEENVRVTTHTLAATPVTERD